MTAIHASAVGPTMYGPSDKLVLLCEGRFNARHAKTALVAHARVLRSQNSGDTLASVKQHRRSQKWSQWLDSAPSNY